MEKIRFNKLGIEIEIMPDDAKFLKFKETKTCVRVSCEGKKVVTILPDSKIEFGGMVHVTCYKGRIVTFGNAYVEVGGMSRVFARDKSRVVAFQGAEVRAGGRVKVRALDSRVIASGRAEVFLDGKSIGYRNPLGRAKMRKFDNRAAISDLS